MINDEAIKTVLDGYNVHSNVEFVFWRLGGYI